MLSESTQIRYLRVVKFVDTDKRMVVSRGLGRREWGLLFNGYGVQFCKMKKFCRWMVVMTAQQYRST